MGSWNGIRDVSGIVSMAVAPPKGYLDREFMGTRIMNQQLHSFQEQTKASGGRKLWCKQQHLFGLFGLNVIQWNNQTYETYPLEMGVNGNEGARVIKHGWEIPELQWRL